MMKVWAGRITENDEEGSKVKRKMHKEVEFALEKLADEKGLGDQSVVMGH